jgi:hypothetical protein
MSKNIAPCYSSLEGCVRRGGRCYNYLSKKKHTHTIVLFYDNFVHCFLVGATRKVSCGGGYIFIKIAQKVADKTLNN